MCHPYDEQEKYFYPARRWAAFSFAAVALQFPYVISPQDTAVWLYVRIFGAVYWPFCLSALFDKYFRNKEFKLTIFGLLWLVVPLICIVGGFLLVLFRRGAFLAGLLKYETTVCIISGVLSVMLTMYYLVVLKWLRRRIDNFHIQNFSNEDDFPYKFAKKVLYVPLIWILLSWIVLVTGSREFKIFTDLLFAGWMIMLLCLILHPQRAWRSSEVERLMTEIEREVASSVEEMEEVGSDSQIVDDVHDTGNEKITFTGDDLNLRDEILAIVRQKYREPNLKRADIIEAVQYGRRRQAGIIISKIGFYRMVNAFRLEHARLYKLKKPYATQEDIAEVSGFKDRWALSNARKKVSKVDFDGINDYLPTSV